MAGILRVHSVEGEDARELGHDFGMDELGEIDLFHAQDWMRAERIARRDALVRKQEDERKAFEEKQAAERATLLGEESWVHEEYTLQIARQIKDNGIDKTRKHMVPAYTFTRFGELPNELQLRIWSMAARSNKPRTHFLVEDADIPDGLPLYYPRSHDTSTILPEKDEETNDFPVLLHVCQASRMVVLKVYTPMPRVAPNHPDAMQYLNTLYDRFYIGGQDSWTDHQLLVDILIRLNSTRPLPKTVQDNMERLLKIRFLLVDFHVFAALPVKIWAEFEQLEKFTIVMYPYDETGEWENTPGYSPFPEFVNVTQRSKYGRRAEWILKSARESFEAVKRSDIPKWTIPQLDTVLRTIEDNDLAGNLEDSSDPNSDPEDEENDDSRWYQQAARLLVHDVPRTNIKQLKKVHHPSEFKTRESKPSSSLEYVGDSETEAGVLV
ncbi:uncharacterized protein LY89DRAFT_733158 [Mollisia scopiformis]|uniref:2EXR domain-containing protein n=1 Tax=Mollisia scopiformis TaxID=149040 RepID=A0A194XAV8_MOLSC|nr:uncharacterized protein LY89DRAFT_733158 [Mollisia scopiformis]KUJ17298.1 hypothetical protein LY89DRAFT_733158 [Mollisia scopiformis]